MLVAAEQFRAGAAEQRGAPLDVRPHAYAKEAAPEPVGGGGSRCWAVLGSWAV